MFLMVTPQPPSDDTNGGKKHRLGKLDKARLKGKALQKQQDEDNKSLRETLNTFTGDTKNG
jgi:hypothetical protein